MEIVVCVVITLLALIRERVAVRRANEYADRVVRRYNENGK